VISTAGVGLVPCGGGGDEVQIASSTALVLPTATQRPPKGGTLLVRVVIEGEGVGGVHYDWNGAAASGSTGLAASTPAAGAPVTLDFEGEDLITALRFIGGAGDTMSYRFACRARA
jgi:hypothetical protein